MYTLIFCTSSHPFLSCHRCLVFFFLGNQVMQLSLDILIMRKTGGEAGEASYKSLYFFISMCKSYSQSGPSQVPVPEHVRVCLKAFRVVISTGRSLSGGLELLSELFPPGILKIHHAVFESLDLALTCSPVLMFSHALLHSIMQLGTASPRYHLFNRVVLILLFTTAVMGGGGCHPVQ